MKPTPLLALLLPTLLSAPLFAEQAPPHPLPLNSLEPFVDRARPLLLFAPNAQDTSLLLQLRLLHDAAAAMTDRQVIPLALPLQGSSPTTAQLTPSAATAARRRFAATPNGFLVILLGKDGGEKFRSTKPVSAATLRALIDAMPMRQSETRQQSRPPSRR